MIKIKSEKIIIYISTCFIIKYTVNEFVIISTFDYIDNLGW